MIEDAGQHVVLSAGTLTGDEVVNRRGDSLGKIEEIMIDIPNGRVAYAVLSFGGFLGMGDRLYAIPWSALELDAPNHRFLLDVEKERLAQAPAFDKDNWPDFTDKAWRQSIYSHYLANPYWG